MLMRTVRPLLFATLLALAAAAHSQAPQAAQPAAAQVNPAGTTGPVAQPVEPPVPLLWKVSDEDNAVYVLGSFHLLKPGDYPLSQDVEAAFAEAEDLLFEMSPEEMASPALGMQMAQAAMRTDGTRLDSELTPEVAGRLQAWIGANTAQLQKVGVTADALQLFEPWFAGLMISLTEMGKMGLDPKLGLDAHFAERAKQAGKPTAGLETGAQQIAFLDGMDKTEQLQMLTEALDESEEGRAEMEKLHRQWREGDADGIREGLGAEMQAKYPQLYRRINVERNDAWVPKLEQRLKSGQDDTLLVVGALHTLGSDGVVEKLAAKGYHVERVCSACAGTGAARRAR
jgi:uncharacterized protein YbaP (TraB family)